jgi:hypothetical protein
VSDALGLIVGVSLAVIINRNNRPAVFAAPLLPEEMAGAFERDLDEGPREKATPGIRPPGEA